MTQANVLYLDFARVPHGIQQKSPGNAGNRRFSPPLPSLAAYFESHADTKIPDWSAHKTAWSHDRRVCLHHQQ